MVTRDQEFVIEPLDIKKIGSTLLDHSLEEPIKRPAQIDGPFEYDAC
jgi:hypothetical protein